MTKAVVHSCELKQDTFGLPKLPPNASWYRKFGRRIRKYLTINPNSTSSKRFFRNRSTMINEQKRHLQGAPFVIHPFSSFNRVRETFFCVLWIAEMILSPIYMSFIHVSRRHRKKTNQQFEYDGFYLFYKYCMSPTETVIVLAFFITGYINHKTKEIVIEPTKIVKKYLNTYYITDIIMCMKFGIYSDITRLMYLMNMFCMVRAGTVFSYLRQIVLNCKMREEVYDCIRLFVITLITLNTLTCFYYYIPWVLSKESFSDVSWVVSAKIHPDSGATIPQAYAECMLCIVCHFFGAGEGIHMVTVNHVTEKLMLIFTMITGKLWEDLWLNHGAIPISSLLIDGSFWNLGRIWTLYVIACVLKIFSVVTISESKYEEYLLQLEVFMRQKRLPQALRNRLIEYYKYKYQNHFFNEQAIFATLSAYLRQELMLYGARKLITKVELFKAFPRSVVGAIIGNARQVVYLPNDIIVKAGDIADEVFFISSGTVAMTTRDGEELVHLEDGDEIGLIGAFIATPYVYDYTYFAVETTEVYVISKKDFRAVIFDQEDLLKYFSKKVQEKIDNYRSVEQNIKVHGYDLLSELSSGKILEHPRPRPTHFEN